MTGFTQSTQLIIEDTSVVGILFSDTEVKYLLP